MEIVALIGAIIGLGSQVVPLIRGKGSGGAATPTPSNVAQLQAQYEILRDNQQRLVLIATKQQQQAENLKKMLAAGVVVAGLYVASDAF